MIILKILFWAIIALVGLFLTLIILLLVLTLIPARILVKYKNGELSAIFKYLFLKINLLKNIEIPELLPKQDNQDTPQEDTPPDKADEVSEENISKAEDATKADTPQAETEKTDAPQAEKVADTQKTTVPPQSKPKPKAVTNNKIIDAGLDKIGEILFIAGTVMRWFFKSIKFKDIVICFHTNGDDAASLAVTYGKTNAAFYSALSVLQNIFKLKFKKIEITPNFENTRADEDIEFSTEIVGTFFSLAIIAIWAIVKLYKEKILFPRGLPFLKKRRRKKKKQNPNNIKNGGITNERQSTASRK